MDLRAVFTDLTKSVDTQQRSVVSKSCFPSAIGACLRTILQLTKERTLYLTVTYDCIVPLGFLPWEIIVDFPGKSQLR